MPARTVIVTANFDPIGAKYEVIVSSAGTDASGSGSYAYGATVSISAGTAPAGQTFKCWTTSSGVSFANANNATTTFTMPANAVTVTAVFVSSNMTYKTVVIGGKIWMAENLNVMGYGEIYDWNTAMSACPSGWHLPSREEWDHLAESVGGQEMVFIDEDFHDWADVGTKLKAKSGWEVNGTDDYGFSALPSNGWWTATEYDDYRVYIKFLLDQHYYDDDSDRLYEYYDDKSWGNAVRCVQN